MHRSESRKRLHQGLAVFLGLFVVLSAWATSMPLGAGPDEPAHIIKAGAVANGTLLGAPTSDPSSTSMPAPAALAEAYSWPCFAYEPDVTAACQRPMIEADSTLLDQSTTAGLYNPVYYMIVGFPAVFDIGPMAMALSMRLLSALLSALLATAIFAVLSRMMPPLFALTTLGVALTPMVYFLGSVVNPNAAEILGGAAFFSGLVWFARSSEVRTRTALVPAITLALGGFIGANSRSVSPFWLFLFGLLFLLVAPPVKVKEICRAPLFLGSLGLVVVSAIGSVIWTLSTGTLGRLGNFPGQDDSPISIFIRMMINAPSDPGLIALFGWLDTTVPGLVHSIYGFGILGLTIAALALSTSRWRLATIGAIVIFFCGPPLLQAAHLKFSAFFGQGGF